MSYVAPYVALSTLNPVIDGFTLYLSNVMAHIKVLSIINSYLINSIHI